MNASRLFEEDMRNEKEKQIFRAIGKNDIETLKEILPNPAGCRLGFPNRPILSIAVSKGHSDVIKHLIDNGCDLLEADRQGRTALHMLFLTTSGETRRSEIVDILLTNYSNPIESVFSKPDKYGMTPFLCACKKGCYAMILRFLSLIDSESIPPMNYVIGYEGYNFFHYLACKRYRDASPTRLETAQALIDKFPYSIN